MAILTQCFFCLALPGYFIYEGHKRKKYFSR